MSDSSSSSSEVSDDVSLEFTEDIFLDDLQLLRGNDSSVTDLKVSGLFPYVQDMTGEDWEQLGRDISNNRHLKKITFVAALDDHTMTSLFRGLIISSSTDEMTFTNNRSGVNGIQTMVPFLQNAINLLELSFFHDNIIGRIHPIKRLTFVSCGLSSIKIDDDYVPNNLQTLILRGNNINADGCREVAKLMRMEHTKLEHLFLNDNKIDDEGISILANALRTNTSLSLMNLQDNEGITIEGMKLVLKLLNDISSIKATLQSNHTLFSMTFNDSFENTDIATEIRRVLQINRDNLDNPDMTGKLKVIHTQLDSKQRAEMCRLQGVQNSGKPLTEFGPLLLPEVLEIVGKYHGLSECYESFRTCVADLWTIIDRKEVLRQQKAELAIELDALVAKRLEVEKQMSNVEMEIDLMEQAELS
ncbi:leucine-rich repeat protein [Skeletonema marinoi]|uniref:Leucine-rich repeat protein n=1 Tax=Skeletonema marinoi TaxID=267567 RepID=A0AAD8YH41_9STRA|nr:leucine-rich repeat protein [Skeletonema marinoi]